ncbi:MAG TPA: hypothetical protein VMZ30_02085 [Pyrinomonadaceae bacterium]|nr:hypothetical protein [Pyrinomonadaceae bacterium]
MKLSNLVNKVAPFKFEYAGEALEGEFYLFKTTTPQYLKGLTRLTDECEEKVSGIEEQIKALQSSDDPQSGPKLAELQRQKEVAEEEQERAGYKWLVEAIKSWNAVGDSDEALPVSQEVFNQLPTPFLLAFGKFLAGLRDGNFTNGASSSSGSQP